MVENSRDDEAAALIRWCDWKNAELGLQEFEWVLMNPGRSPSFFSAVHPVTRALGVRWLMEGDRICITYKTPVRLPFIHPDEGAVANTVISITGTLDSTFQLDDVEGTICAPTDHSVRAKMKTSTSLLRYYTDDTHVVVLYDVTSLADAPRLLLLDTSDELKRYFAHHPEKLRDLAPRKFEELVADIVKDFGFDVQLTSVTRDKGRDIYAYLRNAAATFIMFIECKRWTPPRKVGIEVVQRLYGACVSGSADKGMIVTTSFFTAPALAEAKLISTYMELRDYDAFREWLSRYR